MDYIESNVKGRGKRKYKPMSKEQMKILLIELLRFKMYREFCYILLKVNTPLADITNLKVKNFARDGYIIGKDKDGNSWEIKLENNVNAMLKKCMSMKSFINTEDVNEYLFKSQVRKDVKVDDYAIISSINRFIAEKITLVRDFQSFNVNETMLYMTYKIESMKYAESLVRNYTANVTCDLTVGDIPEDN